MSEDSDSKPYCFPVLEDQGGASGCSGSMAQLHRLAGYSQARPNLGLLSEGSDSSGQDPAASPRNRRKSARSRSQPEEDVEMKSSGSSGSESPSSSHGNSKDSALLESSCSNKSSSNSHSPSPPSSSNAYSLLSSEQDHPSTSGCSSQESAKAKTQKELIKTLKELKRHLPADKHHNKSSTLNSLKYSLRCVRQVEANEEYYQLLMTNESPPSGLDVSSYTVEEIDSITSEYTLKNNDIFAVAVSLVTGRIVYISDQAASILNCKREVFKSSKFVELLLPQDVSVFYSSTTPYRLPAWSMCTGAESTPADCVQEKSFFCRISGGQQCDGHRQYFPFRMTPYRMKVQDTQHVEDQFCCLLLAERVHSGYEGETGRDLQTDAWTRRDTTVILSTFSLTHFLPAPRIPTDKRIFTTTHTASCVFQDVDERAVPLLGYLPQDLIGTPVLLHLHPNDRPIMLAIHRKILQYAGQPFDQPSIRFCARNGEYVVMDTSWSSFVNPWSRKVSFIIGRHKVRTGPVNEDVFVAPGSTGGETNSAGIQEITEQIHRLLLQPVHSSLNSTDHPLGVTTSSSESLNHTGGGSRRRPEEQEEQDTRVRPRTFQEICKGIHLQKSQEQHPTRPDHTRSVESVHHQRSLTVVRPRDSAAPVSWREAGPPMEENRASFQDELKEQSVYSYQQINCLDSVTRYLESCNIPVTVKRRCQSSSHTASSTSDEDKPKGANSTQASEEPALLKDQSGLTASDHKKSSDAATAVVGTSLPLPVPNKPESVVSITSQCSYSSTIVHVGDKKPQPESELIEDARAAAGDPVEPAAPSPGVPPCPGRGSYKRLGLTKQVLAAHTQKEEQAFLCRFRQLGGHSALKTNCSRYLERNKEQITNNAAAAARPGKLATEPNQRRGTRNKKTKSKRAKQTESSDSTVSRHRQQHLRPPLLNHGLNQTSWSPSEASQSTFPMAYPAVMPGYPLQVYPQADPTAPHVDAPLLGIGQNQATPPLCTLPVFPTAPYTSPMVAPFLALVLPNYPYPVMGLGLPPPHPGYQTGFPFVQTAVAATPSFNTPNHFTGHQDFATPSFCFPPPAETPKPVEGQSRSSTPQSGGSRTSPPLFQSRCSSPLNLLDLFVERQDGTAPSSGGPANYTSDREKGAGGSQAKERELKQTSSRGNSNNSDTNSLSSDMLDIILHEDSCSGTGSATSGSMGSGSNGCTTSASGTSKSRTSASGTGSNNSSQYFGSVDSSRNSQKVKGHLGSGGEGAMQQSERFIKYVLPDPLWRIKANTDDKVMMTYQLPSRDLQRVLREDREKLRLLQKKQPHFSEAQQKELMEVHTWMKRGGLPEAVDITMCRCCDDTLGAADGDDLPHLDLGDTDTGDICSQHEEDQEEESHVEVTSCQGVYSACSALQVGGVRQ